MKYKDFEQVGKLSDIEWKAPFEIRYAQQMKTLTFTAIAASESDPSRGYEVTIEFQKVEPTDFIGKRIPTSVLLDKDMKVDCHCKQYVYGGPLKGNIANGCAKLTHSEFTNYERKTDNPNLVRNVDKKPQMCKHLVGLMNAILSEWAIPDDNN